MTEEKERIHPRWTDNPFSIVSAEEYNLKKTPNKISATRNVQTKDRFRGCLLGLAAGDALGTTLEFQTRGSFTPIDDIVGGGPFGLKPGYWTDDTSMALCLAVSLIEKRGFDANDQMERYIRWSQEGYLSSTGYCFDIGVTTSDALATFEDTGDPFSGSTDLYSAGNGPLMRLAPVPMFYSADPEQAIHLSGESSRTTHGAEEAVDACRYFGGLLVGALTGVDKETLLSPGYSPVQGLWQSRPLAEKIAAIAGGSFKSKTEDQVSSTGYVVHTLEAALWAFYHTQSFRDGAVKVVNLGDDADTTGAVYGQIAGAYYGVDDIPEHWRDLIAMNTDILSWADTLYNLATSSDV